MEVARQTLFLYQIPPSKIRPLPIALRFVDVTLAYPIKFYIFRSKPVSWVDFRNVPHAHIIRVVTDYVCNRLQFNFTERSVMNQAVM